MTTMIELPGEGVSVTATCPRCHEPLATTSGSVSWACDTYGCATRIVPMWEDARFVDDTGRQWIFTDEGDWIDVVDDPEVCAGTGRHDGQGVDSCDECCAD